MIKRILFLSCSILSFNLWGQTMEKNLNKLQDKILSEFHSIDGTFALAFEEIGNSNNKILIKVDEIFHAASTMKTPIMIEVFNQAAEGRFNLTDSVTITNEFHSIVDSSTFSLDISEDGGEELYKYIGKKRSIYKLIYDMITVSSNLATNILIELVEAKNVTSSMRKLGAEKINVLRGVEDIKAFNLGMNNTTTVNDLLVIFKAISEGKVISEKSCEEMIKILSDQKFQNKLPKYLPKDVKIAHKTGSISKVEHDGGIIFLPNGRKYILIVLSKDLTDEEKGREVIAKVSKLIYDYVETN